MTATIAIAIAWLVLTLLAWGIVRGGSKGERR